MPRLPITFGQTVKEDGVGVNFSYNLYFKPSQWDRVMKTVVEHALPYQALHQTEVELLSGERLLTPPFEQYSTRYTIPLLVRKDEIITGKEFKKHQLRSYRQYVVVYLILFIYQTTLDPRLTCFRFAAPGSSVSNILVKCPTVREPMLDILEKQQGLCGLFDTEANTYEVFWLEGQQLALPVKMTEDQLKAWFKAIQL